MVVMADTTIVALTTGERECLQINHFLNVQLVKMDFLKPKLNFPMMNDRIPKDAEYTSGLQTIPPLGNASAIERPQICFIFKFFSLMPPPSHLSQCSGRFFNFENSISHLASQVISHA